MSKNNRSVEESMEGSDKDESVVGSEEFQAATPPLPSADNDEEEERSSRSEDGKESPAKPDHESTPSPPNRLVTPESEDQEESSDNEEEDSSGDSSKPESSTPLKRLVVVDQVPDKGKEPSPDSEDEEGSSGESESKSESPLNKVKGKEPAPESDNEKDSSGDSSKPESSKSESPLNKAKGKEPAPESDNEKDSPGDSSKPESSKSESKGKEPAPESDNEEEDSGDSSKPESSTPPKRRLVVVDQIHNKGKEPCEEGSDGPTALKRPLVESSDRQVKKKVKGERIWSDEDAIDLLKAMLVFRKKKGIDPVHNLTDFCSTFLKSPQHSVYETGQVFNKVRSLREKFRRNSRKELRKEEFFFKKSCDVEVYNLSKTLWGMDGIAPKMENEDMESMDVEQGPEPDGVGRGLLGRRFEDMLAGDELLKKGWKLVAASKREEIEARWRELEYEELHLISVKMKLTSDQTNAILKAARSSLQKGINKC